MDSNFKDLYLEDETFEDARHKFNTVLQRLLKSMLESNSQEGTITLKVDISMLSEVIPNFDPDIKGASREIILPSFAYKVTSTVTVKDEQKGNENPQMELVWSEELQKYVLQYVANTAQQSIFDKEYQQKMNSENGTDSIETTDERDYLNVAQITGPVADEGALPGPVEDEIEDAEYREVVDEESEPAYEDYEDYDVDPDVVGEDYNSETEEYESAYDDIEADNSDYDYEEPGEEPEDTDVE